jgi:hypothetical protein
LHLIKPPVYFYLSVSKEFIDTKLVTFTFNGKHKNREMERTSARIVGTCFLKQVIP